MARKKSFYRKTKYAYGLVLIPVIVLFFGGGEDVDNINESLHEFALSKNNLVTCGVWAGMIEYSTDGSSKHHTPRTPLFSPMINFDILSSSGKTLSRILGDSGVKCEVPTALRDFKVSSGTFKTTWTVQDKIVKTNTKSLSNINVFNRQEIIQYSQVSASELESKITSTGTQFLTVYVPVIVRIDYDLDFRNSVTGLNVPQTAQGSVTFGIVVKLPVPDSVIVSQLKIGKTVRMYSLSPSIVDFSSTDKHIIVMSMGLDSWSSSEGTPHFTMLRPDGTMLVDRIPTKQVGISGEFTNFEAKFAVEKKDVTINGMYQVQAHSSDDIRKGSDGKPIIAVKNLLVRGVKESVISGNMKAEITGVSDITSKKNLLDGTMIIDVATNPVDISVFAVLAKYDRFDQSDQPYLRVMKDGKQLAIKSMSPTNPVTSSENIEFTAPYRFPVASTVGDYKIQVFSQKNGVMDEVTLNVKNTKQTPDPPSGKTTFCFRYMEKLEFGKNTGFKDTCETDLVTSFQLLFKGDQRFAELGIIPYVHYDTGKTISEALGLNVKGNVVVSSDGKSTSSSSSYSFSVISKNFKRSDGTTEWRYGYYGFTESSIIDAITKVKNDITDGDVVSIKLTVGGLYDVKVDGTNHKIRIPENSFEYELTYSSKSVTDLDEDECKGLSGEELLRCSGELDPDATGGECQGLTSRQCANKVNDIIIREETSCNSSDSKVSCPPTCKNDEHLEKISDFEFICVKDATGTNADVNGDLSGGSGAQTSQGGNQLPPTNQVMFCEEGKTFSECLEDFRKSIQELPTFAINSNLIIFGIAVVAVVIVVGIVLARRNKYA